MLCSAPHVLDLFFAESGNGMLKRVEVSVNKFQSVVLYFLETLYIRRAGSKT